MLEKFGIQRFVTSIEISQMTRPTYKPNMLINAYTIRRGTSPSQKKKKKKRKINNFNITKTYLYNSDALQPHFYIVKLGFTGIYIIFLISAQNIDCGYSLEPPRRGGSNEYPQSMFCAEIWKISAFCIWKFSFFCGKIFNIVE